MIDLGYVDVSMHGAGYEIVGRVEDQGWNIIQLLVKCSDTGAFVLSNTYNLATREAVPD